MRLALLLALALGSIAAAFAAEKVQPDIVSGDAGSDVIADAHTKHASEAPEGESTKPRMSPEFHNVRLKHAKRIIENRGYKLANPDDELKLLELFDAAPMHSAIESLVNRGILEIDPQKEQRPHGDPTPLNLDDIHESAKRRLEESREKRKKAMKKGKKGDGSTVFSADNIDDLREKFGPNVNVIKNPDGSTSISFGGETSPSPNPSTNDDSLKLEL